MRASLIIAIIIALLAVVFALQNPDVVQVRFGPLEMFGSTALVILITFAIGVLTGILAAVPGRIRASRRAKKLERELDEIKNPDTSSSSATASDIQHVTPIDPAV